ncbi:MAG TPA: DUF6599 family protein [Acidobacteriaceae bacterium]|jgi:hypothetical protein|nr:DUF6599 family protein [Acidobacteriaceae bacterium]
MPLAKILAVPLFLVSALTAAALEPPLVTVLPQSFSTWTQTAAPPPAPDASNAAVLQEYGLKQSATAAYSSGPQHLSVRAWYFADATGAYGAFTFFRQPGMHAETIGHEAASSASHYVFWTGTTVVDATFAHPSADEKSALTALTAQIPQVGGASGVPPSLPHYLPAAQLDVSSVKYAIGPAAYARIGGQLPPNAIDFSQDTEVVTAHYGQQGTLTLLLYPTPQIAGAHLKALEALAQSSGFLTRRSGPLVAIVNGSASPQKAQQLLAAVHFNDYVTINHPEGYVPEGAKLYRLLRGITVLFVVLASAALLLGLFLGGGRALVRKLRGKPVSTVSEEEFISLHLS